MTIKFFVAGTPQGKARPRFTKTGRAYTPQKTVDYENTVKIMYRRVCGSAKFEQGVSLKMNITAYFGILCWVDMEELGAYIEVIGNIHDNPELMKEV